MVRVRASLAQLPAYVPGRKPPGAVVLAGDESSYGVPQGVDHVTRRLRALDQDVPDSHSPFGRLPLADDSGSLAMHCVDGKVVVRPFPGEGVRVTVDPPEPNDALLALAATWRG